MKNNLIRFADDLLWMMYPSLCAACAKPLFTGEECVCTQCRFHLPRTGFHQFSDNPVARHFWGKVRIANATAYYYFSKGDRVQKLIHQLKYKGRKDVGIFAGRTMASELKNSPFQNIDLILPVPLHKLRLRERGYNQSDCFAEGLSLSMNKEFSGTLLERTEATSTQTRKHRFERYRNVDNIFRINNEEKIEGKKILLVDDVITTGSTLISCSEAILSVPGTSVSIAAIACA
jgi:ComF family protein